MKEGIKMTHITEQYSHLLAETKGEAFMLEPVLTTAATLQTAPVVPQTSMPDNYFIVFLFTLCSLLLVCTIPLLCFEDSVETVT
jgi:hypothetical protein